MAQETGQVFPRARHGAVPFWTEGFGKPNRRRIHYAKTEVESEKTDDKTESDNSANKEINMSDELPTTGPNEHYNLIAIFFLSLAFSYYSSSILQKSRFWLIAQ